MPNFDVTQFSVCKTRLLHVLKGQNFSSTGCHNSDVTQVSNHSNRKTRMFLWKTMSKWMACWDNDCCICIYPEMISLT